MTINVPKPEVLQAAFANIQANLIHWNQITWFVKSAHEGWAPPENKCGTTACLAGHVLLSQGVPWDQLNVRDVLEEAMKALGFQLIGASREEVGCQNPISGDTHGHRRWTGDGEKFEAIFYWMDDENEDGKDVDYEYTQEAFDLFKAKVSELTGVQL